MKVLFINDSSSNPNWGDRAAAIALKKMISESDGNIIGTISEEELGCSTFSNKSLITDGEQSIPQSVVKETLKLFIPPLLLKIRQNITLRSKPPACDDVIPQRWEDFDPRLELVISNKHVYSDLLSAVEKSDLLLIHGDGCMTGFDRIPRAELFLTYLAKRIFDKPVIIANHTADFDHPELHKMAQNVYPLYDDVVYRDTISVERNRKLCNGRFAPDSAFYFKPMEKADWLTVAQRPTYFDVWPDIAHFRPDEPYICIGGSSIYYYRSYDAVGGFSQLVEHLRSIYPGQIILTVSDLRDQDIFRPIAKHFNLPLIGLRIPVQQAVDIIGNAEAYIGGRWHPNIFALRGGVPIIPLSSLTFKTQALTEMAGLSSTTFDALNLEQGKKAIGHRLQCHLEQGNELRVKLRAWAEKEADKSWDNVAYLKNCHNSGGTD